MDHIDVTPYVAAWRERRKQEQEQLAERLKEGWRAAIRCAEFLARRCGVRRVYLFGSRLGNTHFHQKSDIDLVVEGLPSEQYIPALTEIWDLLPSGFELDLVPLEDAFPEMIERVQNEGEVLYEVELDRATSD